MIGCLPTQELAFLAVFVYATHATHATHATQAIAFEWKPGLMLRHYTWQYSLLNIDGFQSVLRV